MSRRRIVGVVAGFTMVCAIVAGTGATTFAPAAAQVTIPFLPTTTTAPPPTTAPPTTTSPASTTTTIDRGMDTTVPTPEPLRFDDVPVMADTLPSTTIVSDSSPARTTIPPTVGTPVPAGPPLSAAVIGAYGLGSMSVLLFALVLIGLATHGRSLIPEPSGGTEVNDLQRRWRLYVGFGVLALAGIVALVGYLQLSEEPAVNRQLPYLASAGMAIVILSAIGGSLVVGEQLRTESRRVSELEDAVRHLSQLVAADVERPARRRVRDDQDREP